MLDLPTGERRELLAGAAGPAERVFGLSPKPSPDLEFGEALHALYWLTVRLARRAPLVLAVDDGQWGDRESLAYLPYLVNRIAEEPVLVAVTVRAGEPGYRSGELEALRAGSAAVLRPRPLSAGGTAELIRRRVGERAGEAVAAQIHAAAAGNPFFVLELCRQLDHGAEPGHRVGSEQVGETAPEAVSLSVAARLARLPALASRVAEIVAILGPSMSVRRGPG